MKDSQLSAEYLACCYCYTQAFSFYRTISILFEDNMYSAKERRARMLDMARVAKTRRSCELVRQMLETELEMSNDPLAEEGNTQSSPKAEMCRMQSFLFHRHLAQIYARQDDGAISMQKHFDIARNFTKTFDTHGTESIDLWTLLFFVQDKKDSQIPEELLESLEWNYELYRLNIDHCLLYFWGKLKPTVSLHEASKRYDAGKRAETEPTDLTLQNSPLHIWTRSGILFTFLWKEVQLTHETPLPWGHPTMSSAHILMIVSRIIIKRSCMISKHSNDLLNSKESPLEIHPTNLELYCDALLELFHDNFFTPERIRREFVTQFIEHHSWFPPSASKCVITSQVQNYQMEALRSVLATERNEIIEYLGIKETIASTKKVSENRHALPDNDFSSWLGEHQGQRVLSYQRPADSYIQVGCHPPASHSSRNSSYFQASLASHGVYLGVLKGNPTISRPLASYSSCSSQWSVSSSLQRFKAAGLSWQHQPETMLTLPEDSDVRMDDDFS
jgi:hypothetical protein